MSMHLLDNLTITSGYDTQKLVFNVLTNGSNAPFRLPFLFTSPSKQLSILIPLLVMLQDSVIEIPMLVI